MSNQRKLEGKTALITGGNSGLGLATARLFIQEGAKVAITGRDQASLDAAVKELGPHAVASRTDVTDPAGREQLVASLRERFGKLDIVFANAGISGNTPVGSTEQKAFESVIDINVTAVFFTVQSALPLLRDGASIILNGSVIASLGSPGYAAYAASKGAVSSMARVLAAELSPRNIRVNVVVPGPIRTPIWARGRGEEGARAIEPYLASMVPLGRMGEAEELAKAVLFLASTDSSFVQGTELFVDGGSVGVPSGWPRNLVR
ncbi:SDR family oxidoreductase [Pendulispora brunnea]|uniref:SDR family oxidoreductase n=1 Tax=Pendulispora brunnea TaxID=2905690 RepID=A0ABZ2JYB2_9BACT